ncbi:MAG: hypothetical protein HQ592_07620 [Planctomycetes bacterium]|nr:hypothetical protein [Planctomycetota bacterium]
MKYLSTTLLIVAVLIAAPALAAEETDAAGEKPKPAGEVYFTFDIGPLKTAALEDMPPDVVAKVNGKSITAKDMARLIMNAPEKDRKLYEMTKPFLLGQMLQREAFVAEAARRGMVAGEESQWDIILRMMSEVTGKVTVSDEEITAAYDELKGALDGAELKDVKENIRMHLLRGKQGAAAAKFREEVAKKVVVAVNKAWAEKQHRLATDNPLDKARASGKVTVVDFTASWCPPCKILAPIIEDLKKELPDVNVVTVDGDERPGVKFRYSISAYPTRIFFAADGRETDRVRGLLSRKAILEKIDAAKRPAGGDEAKEK